MRSNICKIENGTKDLDAILKESQKVAEYNELTHKQTLQLRLICEEIDGMLPNIIENFSGDFWIDFEDGLCKVNVSIKLDELTAEKKEELVAIAKNRKNSAAIGIVGKIRSALEDVFLLDYSFGRGDMSLESRYFVTECYNSMDIYSGMDYPYIWSLDKYRSSVNKEEKAEEWDELEKSMIAAVADDIIVGVKGKRADIIVVNKFV